MEYNKERLDEFVANLGFQEEARRLMDAGLTYEQLAQNIYDIFDPRFRFRFGQNPHIFRGYPSKGDYSKRKYEIFMHRYGVGITDAKTNESIGSKWNISNTRVQQIIKSFESCLFPRKDDKSGLPYDMYEIDWICERQKKYTSVVKKELYMKCIEGICSEGLENDGKI